MFGKKSSAKDMIVDFVSLVLAIGMFVFCLFYFVLGDRMQLAKEIVWFFAVISIFGLVFILEEKLFKEKTAQNLKGAALNDVAVYFEESDRRNDLIAILSLPILVLSVSVYNEYIGEIDWGQAVLVLSLSFLWHKHLFKSKDTAEWQMTLTFYDKQKDKLFAYSLPIVMLLVGAIYGSFNVIDYIQALIIFLFYYYWHKFLFRRRY